MITQWMYGVSGPSLQMTEKSGKRRYKLEVRCEESSEQSSHVIVKSHVKAAVEHDVLSTHGDQNATATDILSSACREHRSSLTVVECTFGLPNGKMRMSDIYNDPDGKT